jgi:hypothetical protein
MRTTDPKPLDFASDLCELLTGEDSPSADSNASFAVMMLWIWVRACARIRLPVILRELIRCYSLTASDRRYFIYLDNALFI